jgi:hypothetical protein
MESMLEAPRIGLVAVVLLVLAPVSVAEGDRRSVQVEGVQTR